MRTHTKTESNLIERINCFFVFFPSRSLSRSLYFIQYGIEKYPIIDSTAAAAAAVAITAAAAIILFARYNGIRVTASPIARSAFRDRCLVMHHCAITVRYIHSPAWWSNTQKALRVHCSYSNTCGCALWLLDFFFFASALVQVKLAGAFCVRMWISSTVVACGVCYETDVQLWCDVRARVCRGQSPFAHSTIHSILMVDY